MIEVESDRFARTLESILGNVEGGVVSGLPLAVQKGVRKGATEWRRNARKLFGEHMYKKHGETHVSGSYAKSIRSHMIVKSGPKPSGEVGSPKMPGLVHLLEDGHAKVGGGRVKAYPHVEPAAKVAFKVAEDAVDELVGRVLDDS